MKHLEETDIHTALQFSSLTVIVSSTQISSATPTYTTAVLMLYQQHHTAELLKSNGERAQAIL